MFKKLCVLLSLFLLLCGCAQKKGITPVLNNISFTAEIDYGDTEFMANVTLDGDALNLVVIEPQEIKDLTLKVDKNGITAEFMGLRYTPDIDSLPQGAIIQVLYEIFDDISTSQNTSVCNEENCEIKGEVGDYEYKFIFSPSGLPISLYIDQLDLEIKFKNVTVN